MFKSLSLMKQVDHYRREIETNTLLTPSIDGYLNQRERERGSVEGGIQLFLPMLAE
jgi:hypothetical protein